VTCVYVICACVCNVSVCVCDVCVMYVCVMYVCVMSVMITRMCVWLCVRVSAAVMLDKFNSGNNAVRIDEYEYVCVCM